MDLRMRSLKNGKLFFIYTILWTLAQIIICGLAVLEINHMYSEPSGSLDDYAMEDQERVVEHIAPQPPGLAVLEINHMYSEPSGSLDDYAMEDQERVVEHIAPQPPDPWCTELEQIIKELSKHSLRAGSSNVQSEISRLARKLHTAWSEFSSHCHSKLREYSDFLQTVIPVIYVVTPTYTRMTQKAELTRMSQTLQQVPNVYWVIVEDAGGRTRLVTDFLAQSPVPSKHLNITDSRGHDVKPKGIMQRNYALFWIRKYAPNQFPGVIYFADDDNTYDLQLFEEMRFGRRVPVWPVGLAGRFEYEAPVVVDGKVLSWFSGFKRTRRHFPMDMAGFAVNLQLLLDNPKAWFSRGHGIGEIETAFLQSLGVTWDDLEPKAKNCTQVLVWHTKTENYYPEPQDKVQYVLKSLKYHSGISYKPIREV